MYSIFISNSQTLYLKKITRLLLCILYLFYITKTLILKLFLLINTRKNTYLKVPVVEMEAEMKKVYETQREKNQKSQNHTLKSIPIKEHSRQCSIYLNTGFWLH